MKKQNFYFDMLLYLGEFMVQYSDWWIIWMNSVFHLRRAVAVTMCI